ncbi:unnamed protein product [marine sediment metagenome]|uniref:Ketol-acid reductoisomerase n=1 Tax=marine sediment metagenome TaxID=412755 RepID=X1EV93_9ZZZZ
MNTEIYFEKDGDLSFLQNRDIAIIGYGNQGKAQALNLRDSGCKVIIGNQDDDYKLRAKKDGFETFSIAESVSQAEIIFLLIPDEIMKGVFEKQILPNLGENKVLVFASGYNIGFKIIDPPEQTDVLLIAPRMIGAGVRENYLLGKGFYSFISIEQDASGKAKHILLALCKALGTLKKGAVFLSFKQEAVLDLFNEQAFGPAFGRVLLSSIYTLIDAGYSEEAVLIEMILSGEMEYVYQKFSKIGMVKQLDLHSHTSQYGAITRGIKFTSLPLKKKFSEILENIESGGFTEEWEKDINKLKLKFLKFFATRTRINKIEKNVRKNLQKKEYDIFDQPMPSKEDVRKAEIIKKELDDFEEYMNEF